MSRFDFLKPSVRKLQVPAGALLVLIGVQVLLWRGALRGVPDLGDLFGYFMPFWSFFRSSLLAGSIPFWMDSQELGFPFLYNPQVSLFYVLNYLFLLPLEIGTRLYLTIPFLGFYFGLYLYLRSHQLGVGYSVVAGVFASLTGILIGLYSMTTVLHTVAWLPWLLWMCRVLRTRTGSVWIVLFGFVLSQSFLAGAWDFWMFVIPGVVLIEGLHRWRTRTVLGFLGVSLGLVLPQVLLTARYLPLTIRSDSVSVSESVFWSAGAHHLLGLVSPNIQLSPLGFGLWFETLGNRPGWTLSTYISAAGILILSLGVIWSVMRRRWLLVYCSLLLVVSVSGSLQMLVRFLQSSGISIPVRYPDKMLPILIILLLLVGLRSMPTLARQWQRRGRRFNWLWSAIPALALVACFPFARDLLLSSHSPSYRPLIEVIVGQKLLYEYYTTRDALTFVAFLGLALMVVLVPRLKNHLGIAVLLVGILDLASTGTIWGKIRTASWEGALSRTEQVIGGGPARFAFLDAYLKAESAGAKGSAIVWSQDPMHELMLMMDFPHALSDNQWFAFNGFNVLPLRSSRMLTMLASVQPDSVRREILWRSGVRWLIGDSSAVKKFLADSIPCHRAGTNGAACPLNAGGMARWNERVVVSDSIPQSAIRMLATERDRHAAYVTRADVGDWRGDSSASSGAFSAKCLWGVASRTCALPAGHSEGVLVFAHSFHPDWIATDGNGDRLKVVPADYAFLGVLVPDGTKSVELRFSSKPLWISLVAGLLVLGASMLLLWGRR